MTRLAPTEVELIIIVVIHEYYEEFWGCFRFRCVHCFVAVVVVVGDLAVWSPGFAS